MAQRVKNIGSLEASDALSSLVDGAAAYMDYDSGTTNARFGAKGGAGGNVGVLIRTLLAGAAISAMAFVPAGAATLNSTLSAASGTDVAATIATTVNQSGTASYVGFSVDATQSATGSGTKLLMRARVGGVTKWSVDNTGAIVGGTASYTDTAGSGIGWLFTSGTALRMTGDNSAFSFAQTASRTLNVGVNNRIIINESGLTITLGLATTVSSTLAVTSDFAVNTSKFTVAASSGNTVVAGTLAVTGSGLNVTAAGQLKLPSSAVVGAMQFNGADVLYSDGALTLLKGTSTINFNVNGAIYGIFDLDNTAGGTRLQLWDNTAGANVRVSRGASDSGGTGFRLLRIPN